MGDAVEHLALSTNVSFHEGFIAQWLNSCSRLGLLPQQFHPKGEALTPPRPSLRLASLCPAPCSLLVLPPFRALFAASQITSTNPLQSSSSRLSDSCLPAHQLSCLFRPEACWLCWDCSGYCSPLIVPAKQFPLRSLLSSPPSASACPYAVAAAASLSAPLLLPSSWLSMSITASAGQ